MKLPKFDELSKRVPRRILIAVAALTLLLVVILTVVFIFAVSKHEELPESSPLPRASSVDFAHEKTWGTYRPHLYFGLKAKHVESPLFGMMWYRQPTREYTAGNLTIRHWCDATEPVEYDWKDHDGKSFGSQWLKDGNLTFRTNWFNTAGNSCLASVNVDRRSNGIQKDINDSNVINDQQTDSYGFIFYFATQDNVTYLNPTYGIEHDELKLVEWDSAFFGKLSLSLKTRDTKFARFSYKFARGDPTMDMTTITNFVQDSLERRPDGKVGFKNEGRELERPTFVALQIIVEDSDNVEIKLRANGEELPENFAEEFETKLQAFREKFKQAFPIQNIDDPESYAEVARSALSNLLGGISFWHGVSMVKRNGGKIEPYGPLDLISAVPSRTTYPRGFLWDEGFHQLLIREIDQGLSLEIMGAWLDTMDEHGWIPREQVLDPEAKARAPPGLTTESDVANPPMFFYLIDKCLKNPKLRDFFAPQIRKLYPRLKALYLWLRRTQIGPVAGTFQWRGRYVDKDASELNAGTLPSGFDDYPRASHPTRDEYHLDLRCWMAMSSRVLYDLANLAGDTNWIKDIKQDMTEYNDMDALDRLHWSESAKQYSDWGLHSNNVTLVYEHLPDGRIVTRRKVWEEPVNRHVDNVNGYANLFPLLLKMLPADSPKLEPLLMSINDTEDFWTSYGLRSIAKRGSYYNAYNNENSKPYWRGPIWINMNYFALDALQHYAKESKRYGRFCAEVYKELRLNLVRNIVFQYNKTGFFWENYKDETGEGQFTHPFTGWTTMFVLALAEKYD